MNYQDMLKNNPAMYDAALAIIRVIVGIVFVAHGWQKLNGLDGTTGFFTSLGIPAAGVMAVIVTFVELVGGLALIAGLATRLFAPLLAITMLVALLTFHLQNGFYASNGGYEFVLVLLAASVGFALAGAGRLSVDNQLFGS